MSHAGETTMARYFGKNRGKAISVGTLGGMIGVMILPILAVKLSNFFGWQQVWLISSLSILIIFLPCLFLALGNQNNRHLNFKQNSDRFEISKKWKTRQIIFHKKFYMIRQLSHFQL